ncbi:MAG: DUF1016 domain-containing protein [Leptolyngbya sp. SIO4C5]|nr:DUF1016 domain-containing protein [Leptolyngbya sp. SIO4C5]
MASKVVSIWAVNSGCIKSGSSLPNAASSSKPSGVVNRELVLLYWHIGQEILQRQREQGWGTKVIPCLAKLAVPSHPAIFRDLIVTFRDT